MSSSNPIETGQQDIDFTSQSDPSSADNTMRTQSPPSNDMQITHTSINTRNILPTISKYRPHRKSSLPQIPPRYENAVECPICFLVSNHATVQLTTFQKHTLNCMDLFVCSFTHLISITRDVVTSLYVLNALFISDNLQSHLK